MAANNDVSNSAKDFLSSVMAEMFKKENVNQYEINIIGEGIKAHHGSDIVFVEATGEGGDGEKRDYSLVIKYGQMEAAIRDNLPIRKAFDTEISVYSKIIPRYQKFQSEKGLPLLSFTANCYLTKLTDSKEAIVLDNLKTMGYLLHDNIAPMDLNHTKLILEAFAEWHALSFALQDQHQQDFLEISEKIADGAPIRGLIESMFGKIINFELTSLYAVLEESGKFDLLNRRKSKFGNQDASTIFLNLLDHGDDQSVILHGDCWNDNFMFKYSDQNSTLPIKVKVLDFQMTSVRSPMVDISHIIFAVSSGKELQHLEELVQHYYQNLSNHLKKLGSDPDKIFPLESLKSHWRKYSPHGLLISLFVPLFLFRDKGPQLDFTKEEELVKLMPTLVSNPQYRERVRDMAKYFVEFEI